LPTDAEWEKLFDFAGGSKEKTAGKKLKAKTGWPQTWGCTVGELYQDMDDEYCSDQGKKIKVPNNGTDNYGFAALPGTWWSATECHNPGCGSYWFADYNPYSGLYKTGECYCEGPEHRNVRCVKD
jgi:uncharacterized protein (TIGR02145 family)